MLMMMDCSNRKPPVDLSGAAVAATTAAGTVPSSPEEPAVAAGTWHPHVYGNPPRTPTAHNIADILGWTAGRNKTAAAAAAGPPVHDEQPLNLSTARRPNGTVLDLTKIKRKGECCHRRRNPSLYKRPTTMSPQHSGAITRLETAVSPPS